MGLDDPREQRDGLSRSNAVLTNEAERAVRAITPAHQSRSNCLQITHFGTRIDTRRHGDDQ
jgi:hypothetical protein